MGKLNFNSGLILEYSVNIIQETNDRRTFNVIHMNITSETIDLKYRISSDDNHPDLNIICQELNSGLNQAFNSELPFGISEYSERMYIFITYPDGNTKKYTAVRL